MYFITIQSKMINEIKTVIVSLQGKLWLSGFSFFAKEVEKYIPNVDTPLLSICLLSNPSKNIFLNIFLTAVSFFLSTIYLLIEGFLTS